MDINLEAYTFCDKLYISCNLAQEYGDVINFHDRYISFEGIVKNTNSNVKRKFYSSPSKKKSKSTPLEGEAMIHLEL